MKKLLILLCALALTGCAAKGGNGKNVASGSDLVEYPANVTTTRTSLSDLEVYDNWGITLTMKDVTPEGGTIVCAQSGGKNAAELMTGAAFVVEVKDGSDWSTYPALHAMEDVVWTLEGWMIQKNGSVEWQTDWSWLYGTLPAGEYRIGKDVMNWKSAGEYEQMRYYAEFTVE